MDKKVHILYPLVKSSIGECEELRYSLRSIDEHIKAPFDVTIIGYKPQWLDTSKVRYIYYGQMDERYKNSLHAIDIMANIVDNFVLFNDDFYIINDITEKELTDIYYLQNLNQVINWGNRYYQQMLKQGFDEIKAKGLYGLSYATHAPQFYKSKIVREVIYNQFNLFDKNFVAFENFYYNYIKAEKVAKPIYDYRVARYDKTPFKEEECNDKIFLNFDEDGMKSGIWQYIVKRFNKKSKFEL